MDLGVDKFMSYFDSRTARALAANGFGALSQDIILKV